MIYRFTRHVFRKGRLVHLEKMEIDGARVETESPLRKPGREAFLELINTWNNRGLIGMKYGGPQYLYTAN